MIAYVDASVLLRVALGQPDALPEWRKIEQGVSSALVTTESLRTLDRLRLRTNLADAEIGIGFRIRQVLSEENHRIQPWDEASWARRYNDVDVESALASYLASRRWNLSLLRRLSSDSNNRK